MNLRNVGTRALPEYEVRVLDEYRGRVYRTGSLPSCYRWWADGLDENGFAVTLKPSKRTRAEAVDLVLGQSARLDSSL